MARRARMMFLCNGQDGVGYYCCYLYDGRRVRFSSRAASRFVTDTRLSLELDELRAGGTTR